REWSKEALLVQEWHFDITLPNPRDQGTGGFFNTKFVKPRVTAPWSSAAWDWVQRNIDGLMKILSGVIDIAVGIAGLFSVCPVSVACSVGLIIVGVDQLASGIYDVYTGTKNLTLLGTLAKNVALDFGADPVTANAIGDWAPVVLSTALTLGASFASCFP